MKRRWWILLLAAFLVFGAVRAFAGPLTAGNYTYIYQGRELELPVDILTVQGATLVPEEMLNALGVPAEVQGDAVTLARGPVQAELTLGSDNLQVEGKNLMLRSFPVRVSGRLFVPAEALSHLGLEITLDGKFVLIREYSPVETPPQQILDNASFQRLLTSRTVEGTVRGNSGAYANATFTVLNRALLADSRINLPWGTRIKLLEMLQNRTLILVTLSNTSLRTVSLDPAKLLLRDDKGRQYDYLKSETAIDGTVTSTVAPGARRTSILAYDLVSGAGSLALYYEPNGDFIGTVNAP